MFAEYQLALACSRSDTQTTKNCILCFYLACTSIPTLCNHHGVIYSTVVRLHTPRNAEGLKALTFERVYALNESMRKGL